jgi:PCO_ADO
MWCGYNTSLYACPAGFDEEDINGIDESVCATISITKNFNIAVFMIPKGHGLPLHDHPHMTVLSKVAIQSLVLTTKHSYN